MKKKIKEFIIEDFKKAYSCDITYQSILKQQEEVYTRLKLASTISEYLGLEEIPFEFAELENELSRIVLKPVPKILITDNYCMRYENAAFCLAHELRHAFQIYWANFMDDSLARIWRDELSRPKNALNIDVTNEENVAYEYNYTKIDFTEEKLKVSFERKLNS